jgi:murein peptide amidase A
MSELPQPPSIGVSAEILRLGKNLTGYAGETVDIHGVLGRIAQSAQERGWRLERLKARPGLELLALGRMRPEADEAPPPPFADPGPRPRTRPRVYLSTGIHGDEPAGPLAILGLLEADRWPEELDLWICPCLNPAGFALNRRENDGGLDLNRDYLQPKSAEIQAHIRWLDGQPCFDLSLCLHEDWESHGFYVYELNPDQRPTLAEAIVEHARGCCPIDPSAVIEGRPAQGGIIRPALDPRARPQWPEAFYLISHKTRLSYTLEAPSDFPLACRVAALAGAVNGALEKLVADFGKAGGTSAQNRVP